MKKLISILLLAALLLTLCACGKKDEPAIGELPVVDVPENESETVETTADPNTVHVVRTPEPQFTAAPEGGSSADSPSATAAPAPTASPAVAEPVGTPVVTVPTPQPTVAPPPPVSEVSISSGSAVYSLVDRSGSYTDSLGNSYTYQYKVPAFGCTGPDTELLSEELYNALMPIVDRELAAMQNGSSLTVSRIDYSAYSNGRYVSVLCSMLYPDGSYGYKAVTLNADTGFRATNAELMQYAGISGEQFGTLAAQAAADKFVQLHGQPGDNVMLSQAYNDTVSASNFSSPQLFLDGNGRLAFAAKIYSVAGASYYEYILSV